MRKIALCVLAAISGGLTLIVLPILLLIRNPILDWFYEQAPAVWVIAFLVSIATLIPIWLKPRKQEWVLSTILASICIINALRLLNFYKWLGGAIHGKTLPSLVLIELVVCACVLVPFFMPSASKAMGRRLYAIVFIAIGITALYTLAYLSDVFGDGII